MDRRGFICQALITALAAGPFRSLPSHGGILKNDEPVCDLPGGYCYGLYDNFDGEGCVNPNTGEHLAREGEFSPSLWQFYRRSSEITHMDDIGGSGKRGPVPVDDDGVPVSVYRDPALAMISKYLVGERPGEDRLYDITPLLDGVTLSVLHGESDPRSMVEQLLDQSSIFSPEGEVAAQYMRTGDLWLLHGMSSWTLEAIQKIKRGSGYVAGQGPRRVRFLERDLGGQEREAGSIGLVPKDELGSDLAQEKRSKEDRVLPMPHRVTGRRIPTGLRANPSGYVVKMENSTGVDMRLELVNPSKVDFADFYSWSADLMMSSETTQSGDHAVVGLDFHTSIPEQPPGVSWFAHLFVGYWPHGGSNINAQISNKNTGHNELIYNDSCDLDRWYNLRMDMITRGDSDIRLTFFIDGRLLGKIDVPEEDAALLLNPSASRFGPIRSFECHNGPDDTIVAYIDNVKAVYA